MYSGRFCKFPTSYCPRLRINPLICVQCNAIHKTIVDDFRVAVVYGKSVKHQPQRVGLTHELGDEDISMSIASVDRNRIVTNESPVTIVKK